MKRRLAVMVVLLALAACTSKVNSGSRPAPTVAASTTTAVTTTLVATTDIATTAVATTALATTVPATAAPTTTTILPGGGSPPMSAGGALLRPSTAHDTGAITGIDPIADCHTLATAARSVESCGVVDGDLGQMVWAVFIVAADNTRYAAVFEQTTPGTWAPRIDATEPGPGLWDSAKFVQGDYDGDGAEELLFGVRDAGTGGFLELDIVDLAGGVADVVGHVTLQGGAAAGLPGKIRTQKVIFRGSDPNCCPSQVNRLTIQFVAGAWRIVDSQVIDTAVADAFPNDFP